MYASRFSRLLASASFLFVAGFAASASAQDFNVPSGDLKSALDAYAMQSGLQLMYGDRLVEGIQTKGAKGPLSADAALSRILKGTGFEMRRDASGAIAIVRDEVDNARADMVLQTAQASSPRTSVETVTVTSSKLGGADVQSIPIAITALSQEQLTSQQIAGGPDLIKSVPNLTFTKTNFTGYSIQIRGIGTQAISVTTDPAVAVAFNDTPFIRNHFFEQEFFDIAQVEVLRGPQGTLYGRNATAGVVNVISAKPTDHWEAMASVDVGNYNNRRLEGMLNIPIVGDKLDLRVAGEWTKRDGYTLNETTDKVVDGRDLWSGRLTLGFHPIEWLTVNLVWEHFSEDDDRMRTAKQLCKKDSGPNSADGYDLNNPALSTFFKNALSQGCLPTSLYSADAFQTPNGRAIPFVALGEYFTGGTVGGSAPGGFLLNPVDPYATVTQPRDLRVIQSEITPTYRARNDTIEFNADFALTPALTLTSQTGYNKDELASTEDFNRFNTVHGFFGTASGDNPITGITSPVVDGVYCDPQLGCSDTMVAEDLSRERAWQFSQEVRLSSHFDGPFNFSLGANYMHYQTVEDYFVFFNLLSAEVQLANFSGPGDYSNCYTAFDPTHTATQIQPVPIYSGVIGPDGTPLAYQGITGGGGCTYIDPNPLSSINGLGHNYFRSENPYRVNSFAGFGEAYYQLTPDLKLTAGLRWTDDNKRFWNVPSWTFLSGGGYPVQSIVNQEWKEWTGRFNATWTPRLDFTNQTMLYASYARGYKGGGANPPGLQPAVLSQQSQITHPPLFAPEFVNAYELGTKNTLFDNSVTLNGDLFFYDYKGYQISQIVDRTSVNLNFDATVRGAELESTWEPLPGLRFNLSGGLQTSSVDNGQSAVDLIDRTAGHADWMVVKPFVSDTSNCILPASLVKQLIQLLPVPPSTSGVVMALLPFSHACEVAYAGIPGTASDFSDFGITGFNPALSPNDGAGFSKDLSGHELPNTPHFNMSLGAQYSMPVSENWAATLRGDFYLQSGSWARVFNDDPYDRIHGYKNVNLALIMTNQDGWQAMAYVKNVFNTTAITGAFLNSDDTALTTNVFVTDPRLFGLRLTKNW